MIGKKYTKPLMLVMLVAFFTSVICSEILFKQIPKIDVINNTIKGGYLVLMVFRDICTLVCVAILLWLGTYYLFMKKMRALSSLAILVGLMTPVGQGLNALLYRHATMQYVKILNDPQLQIEQYRTTLNDKQMPQDKRASLSKISAGIIYEMSGKSMQVMDANGNLAPYVPTQKDIEQRKQYEHFIFLMHATQVQMILVALVSFFIAFLSTATAFFCYRSDKRKMSVLTAD